MDLHLSQKTAFISGSTSGIGYATAKSLALEGANVILNGRTRHSVQEAVDRLSGEVGKQKVSGIPADFSKGEEVQALISELPDIDILINNVGIYNVQSFYSTQDKEWVRHFEVNVLGGVRLSRALLPSMLERDFGRIIFISSECATLVPEDLIAYSVTKAGLLALSRGLAQLTKGSQVTVNTILPGSTLTEGAEQLLKDVAEREDKSRDQVEREFFANFRNSSLLQRFAKVEEVAATITYLCSPLALATNGSAIKTDGGSMGGIL